MGLYTTSFPVLTPFGKVVVPAGVPIDDTLLLSLKKLPADRRMISLSSNGTFKKDIKRIFQKDVYSAIFREKSDRKNILLILKNISLPYIEYEIFEYFKANDFSTYEHLLSVFILSAYISAQLSMSNNPYNSFYGSLSHDIGKCTVPMEILNKSSPLTKVERKKIEYHTIAGYCLLHYFGVSDDNESPIIARDHHENTTGTGYPLGKKNITLNTEIVIACDIYDALLSPRAYRNEAFTNRTALEELTRIAFDGKISQDIVRAFVAGSRIKKTAWYECNVSHEYRGKSSKNNNYGKYEV